MAGLIVVVIIGLLNIIKIKKRKIERR